MTHCKIGHSPFYSKEFCLPNSAMYYVYVIQNLLSYDLYIGFTTNVKQRVFDHNSGKGARTTRRKGKWRLIYLEGYLTKNDAVSREKFLKGGSGLKYLKKQLKNYFGGAV
jgi:putative endonuclease